MTVNATLLQRLTAIPVRRENGIAIIAEVKRYGAEQGWHDEPEKDLHRIEHHVRHVAHMSIMCSDIEAGRLNYGNWNVHGSYDMRHDAMGSDHTSVGCMQQQVGYDGTGQGFSWGDLAHCQHVQGATESFVKRLAEQGGDRVERNAYNFGAAIQKVQVSAFPSRYRSAYYVASRFLNRHYHATAPFKHPLS